MDPFFAYIITHPPSDLLNRFTDEEFWKAEYTPSDKRNDNTKEAEEEEEKTVAKNEMIGSLTTHTNTSTKK
jgi:hypothetical protein